MNFEPEIELYAKGDLEVVYESLFEKLGETGLVKVERKLSRYQSITVETLFRTGTLDFINGSTNPRLYEHKVKRIQIPVRFVCALEGRTLVLLDVFFTSGSSGAVEKHLSRASARLVDWRMNNRA
ncbi:MAG: hypothetical protein B7W96_00080 [Parcubacteria group bacterium 37-58-5]|nr:MAG: hypothetical protein B7W96_00080 [Parcubacteria group bacterium 37-58-5]